MGDSRRRPERPHERFRAQHNGLPRKRAADEQEDAWVAGEDRFVLKQAKMRAEIRVKEGRAKPIDWLAVTLRFIDKTRTAFDDEIADSELQLVDPEGIFESLNGKELADLHQDIEQFLQLETDDRNRDFWESMQIICDDRRQKTRPAGRGKPPRAGPREEDVIPLLAPKNFEQLRELEAEIMHKMRYEAKIDAEYWENLVQFIRSYKARARLREISQSIIQNQLQGLRTHQAQEAALLQKQLENADQEADTDTLDPSFTSLDPEAMLKVAAEDKHLGQVEERVLLDRLASDRNRILKLGFVPAKQQGLGASNSAGSSSHADSIQAHARPDELSQAANALYEREVARGVGENEEVFTGEEEIQSKDVQLWSSKYRPRKPRYFNRVQMGYEWNKYNQTHYDHDNPPPKVVQGYKFNIFYPDLIDKAKAPTYKIERENGRRRGQTQAGTGEEDSCIIRFIAGPPYEDVAFRIVDRDWDYSAKRERGFRSSFEKGILQLHFQFKKIFYRK